MLHVEKYVSHQREFSQWPPVYTIDMYGICNLILNSQSLSETTVTVTVNYQLYCTSVDCDCDGERWLRNRLLQRKLSKEDLRSSELANVS